MYNQCVSFWGSIHCTCKDKSLSWNYTMRAAVQKYSLWRLFMNNSSPLQQSNPIRWHHCLSLQPVSSNTAWLGVVNSVTTFLAVTETWSKFLWDRFLHTNSGEKRKLLECALTFSVIWRSLHFSTEDPPLFNHTSTALIFRWFSINSLDKM